MAYTFEQLEEAMKNNHAARKDFIKTVLSLAIATLAIMASFQNGGQASEILTYLYIGVVIPLLLGILSGGIVLWFDTYIAKNAFLRLKETMLRQLAGKQTTLVTYTPPKLFYIAETICYISLMLGMLMLGVYSCFKAFL